MTYPTYDTTIDTRWRKPGSHWKAGYHPGVDFEVPPGSRVSAPAPSTIVFAGRYGGWGSAFGKHVVGETILGGKRYRWIVAHLSAINVSKGQHVAAGQLVGASGATGNVTGPHVHIEVRDRSFGYGQDVDPQIVLAYKPGPIDKMDPANYGPGHVGPHVTWLGERLVAHGFGRHYKTGPGPVWGDADKANVRDFQLAQGWTGGDADGLPGRETLKRLAADPKPSAKLPAQLLDLRRAKLTIPFGKEDHPTEIKQPGLSRYVDARCFFVRDDSVVFRVTGSGVTTENSDNPRTELREMENGTEADWTTRTIKRRVLAGLYLVKANAKVVIQQIHDDDDDVVMVSWNPGGAIVVEWSNGKGQGSDKTKVATVRADHWFHVEIIAGDGVIKVLFNGTEVAKRKMVRSGCYQKAGAYLQSDNPKHWAEVAVRKDSLKMGLAA